MFLSRVVDLIGDCWELVSGRIGIARIGKIRMAWHGVASSTNGSD
jgi:hypothetical protein